MAFQQLPKGYVVAEADTSIEHVYFLESGLASMGAVSPEGLEVEAGLSGREGMGPAEPLMASTTAIHRTNIQIAADAWRIARAPLTAAVDEGATLRRLLLRYVQALLAQTSFTALCNAVHHIDERLARWLLMCDDGMDGRDIPLTHEFLSVMLAVRRPGVTTALHVLEGNKLTRTERGCIVILDRKGLEQFARDAYGKPEAVYRELIGPM